VFVYVEGKKIPIVIYNKHNINESEKRLFKQYKYKTKPKMLIGDKTTKVILGMKERFSDVNSLNSLIDTGLNTISDVVTLKTPVETKYRIVSNEPIKGVFTDGKRIWFN
jgi:hypothetical protein